ncbi:hypothetical protein EVAR_19147_1 [Eumeta japonica]|uniref:Uncharacterized protein n=1 Tax=Eumeta variegata TaxID=151549 RepID=A0A4C1VNB8_EUMVA|nr:hypothetical protein EVAR_19147_1 [Eumeta japonica]
MFSNSGLKSRKNNLLSKAARRRRARQHRGAPDAGCARIQSMSAAARVGGFNTAVHLVLHFTSDLKVFQGKRALYSLCWITAKGTVRGRVRTYWETSEGRPVGRAPARHSGWTDSSLANKTFEFHFEAIEAFRNTPIARREGDAPRENSGQRYLHKTRMQTGPMDLSNGREKFYEKEPGCGWESLMKSVTLGNVTMSHRTRERPPNAVSHSQL